MSVNKIILVGNLGQDPEIRLMPDGSKIANFSVATSERWKDKNGEIKSVTEWHRVVVFNPKLASIIERYFKKGKKVFVEGSLRTRKWVDKEGKEQKSIEVVVRYQGTVTMLESKSQDTDHDLGHSFGPAEEQDCLTMEEDEIPF
ncbi:single-stranded DNA-binding protein [Holospora curviuscula]|uniref:Single-stranded DNA-binding protein n=1 Tax=Holospora curviuscula TaxID=1082868 RepID=A0A2S5R8M4_9PROT|nr:single-stranded DNA-binding protein [Holospora curviuscula]PPE03532.1 Single-stranded DNA-binding protein [Holospora curviuscula]